MPQLMCARKEADLVDFVNERFVVCKTVGVNIYGKKYEMGDVLPEGALPPRALAEIYDTPLHLIESMDYALADEELLAIMMTRPTAEEGEVPEKEPLTASAPVALKQHVPDVHRPNKNEKRKSK